MEFLNKGEDSEVILVSPDTAGLQVRLGPVLCPSTIYARLSLKFAHPLDRLADGRSEKRTRSTGNCNR